MHERSRGRDRRVGRIDALDHRKPGRGIVMLSVMGPAVSRSAKIGMTSIRLTRPYALRAFVRSV